jgi:hypothetical protein
MRFSRVESLPKKKALGRKGSMPTGAPLVRTAQCHPGPLRAPQQAASAVVHRLSGAALAPEPTPADPRAAAYAHRLS